MEIGNPGQDNEARIGPHFGSIAHVPMGREEDPAFMHDENGTRSRRTVRRLRRWGVVGVALASGTLAAFASSRVFSAEPPVVRAAAPVRSPATPPKPPEPRPAATWPRPLPRDPAHWLRRSAAECGLKITGLRTEAHATTYPSPSGAPTVLWEVSFHVGAEGTLDAVRALVDRLATAPCGVNAPELTVTWLPGNRVQLQLHAVLLGTWPDRAPCVADVRT